MVKAAAESGMKSVALTDKYVMNGAIEFYREAICKNIKPIIGCEVCILHNRRLSYLVILVKNAKGYGNLCQIISKSHLERKAQVPVVELPYLKEMGEGLIGLSGCSRGEIPYLLKEKNVAEAIKSAKEYRELFEGDFYVGIQRYPVTQSRLCKTSVSEILINFALKVHLPIVATNNVHYLSRKDYEIYKSLFKLKLMSIKNDPTAELIKNSEHYFKSESEMENMFSDIPEAIINTETIVGERKRNGNFKDILNFYRRTSKNCKVTKKAIENLIRVGAFDFTNLKRKYLLLVFYYLKNLKDIRSNLDDKNCFFFKSKGYLEDFNLEERLEAEEEILGFFVSTNPLQYFKDELKELNVISSKYFFHAIYTGNKKTERSINCTYLKDIFVGGIVIARRIEKTKKGKAMLFCTLEDESGMYESVFFPDIYKKNAKIIMNETPVVIKGRLYLKDEHISIVARDVISLISLKKLKRESRRDYVKNNLLIGVKPAW